MLSEAEREGEDEMIRTRFDEWEESAVAWLEGRQMGPPEPLTTKETLGLLRLCKRAYAIEHSVTQGQERALRQRYRELLDEALGIRDSESATEPEQKGRARDE